MIYFKGRENVYTCQICGGFTVTVDRDHGVTPMFLDCRASAGCKGMAVSSGYPPGPRPPHIPAPAWEWYRPSPKETAKLERKQPGMAEHVRKGGLAIRRIAQAGEQ